MTTARSAQANRTVGLVLLGSSLALGTFAALTVVGLVPVAEDVRPWVGAGAGLMAVADAVIGFFFLRAASPS